MNESEKNIETCLPESILAEVASVPTDPQFVSLVNESLDPLKQQAVQQAGSDAYNEVVASHKPYTFTSQVAQMKSNLILLLRRFWRFPFGNGTLRSLSDMWQHYITRLQGNETYGIPSRLDQLTDLPSAPLLVADRKIVADGVPDGISLMRLVLSRTNGITKIGDGVVFDICYKSHLYALIDALPDLNEMEIHCKRLTGYDYSRQVWFPSSITKINGSSEVLEIPELERFEGSSYCGFPSEAKNFKVWSFPNMTYSRTAFSAIGIDQNYHNDWVEEIRCPKTTQFGGYASESNMGNFDVLRKVTLGAVTADITNGYHQAFYNDPNLIHLEFGADGGKVAINLWLNMWSPTNALDQTGTDLVEDPTAHPTWNNLQQFLSNFRSFIVLRLANRKSTTALTLTLSAAVYNAVTGANSGWASQHTLAELGITDNDLTDLETELGFNPAETTYASWLDTYTGANGIHWDINKAN